MYELLLMEFVDFIDGDTMAMYVYKNSNARVYDATLIWLAGLSTGSE